MRRLWILLALPVAAITFVWLAGILVGPHYSVKASLQVEATPEAIWKALNAVENYPNWRPDVTLVEMAGMKPDMKWKEYDGKGRLANYTNTGSVLPGKWVSQMTSGVSAMHASRTLLIVALEAGGTLIEATEEGDISNPIERFRYRFQIGYSVALQKFLADLRKRLGE